MPVLDSQQIPNPRNSRIDHRPRRIHTQPPRAGVRNCPVPDHHHILLDPVLRQHHGHVLGQRVPAQVLRQRALAVDHHVAPGQLAVQPALLLPRLAGQQRAEEGGEGDEEDARRGVGARRGGRPFGRVERGGERGLEDGHHAGRVCRGRVPVHAHCHARIGVCGGVAVVAGEQVACIHFGRRWVAYQAGRRVSVASRDGGGRAGIILWPLQTDRCPYRVERDRMKLV